MTTEPLPVEHFELVTELRATAERVIAGIAEREHRPVEPAEIDGAFSFGLATAVHTGLLDASYLDLAPDEHAVDVAQRLFTADA